MTFDSSLSVADVQPASWKSLKPSLSSSAQFEQAGGGGGGGSGVARSPKSLASAALSFLVTPLEVSDHVPSAFLVIVSVPVRSCASIWSSAAIATELVAKAETNNIIRSTLLRILFIIELIDRRGFLVPSLAMLAYFRAFVF